MADLEERSAWSEGYNAGFAARDDEVAAQTQTITDLTRALDMARNELKTSFLELRQVATALKRHRKGPIGWEVQVLETRATEQAKKADIARAALSSARSASTEEKK